MKRILFRNILILASLTFLWACDGDDDGKTSGYSVTNVSEVPEWQIDWSSNQERPDWQEPVASNYENWAVMLFIMEDELRPYVDENDMMALFVGNELRGLASPAISIGDGDDDSAFFLLKAYGNDSGQTLLTVTLRYYSSRLKHIFTRSAQIYYEPDKVYGIDEDLQPQFSLGSEKYPIVMNLPLSTSPLAMLFESGQSEEQSSKFQTAASPIVEPSEGDIVAAFVGSECRGIYTLDDNLLDASVEITVFGRSAGESVTLKYFDADEMTVYTFTDAVKVE